MAGTEGYETDDEADNTGIKVLREKAEKDSKLIADL